MVRHSVSLFRRIERALETIALGSTPLETIHQTAHFLADNFANDLGLRGGRIYAQDNGSYELVRTFGELVKAPLGLRIWRTYPPFDQLLEVGAIVMERSDERLDQRLEQDLGTRELFAAISVADGRYVLSFDVEPSGAEREDLIATLNIVRLAINQKLREEHIRTILEDVRRIQNSILPRHLPSPGEYEIGARSVPAELVGGDFYDVITFGENLFDVVVADATGHGLPAALQVRDVFTGLRMGLARDFKLTRTVERLNRIIHRSRLSTKFVSLILAEIEAGGSVFFCNAGHPAGLLVRTDGSVERLTTGGMVLGPTLDATYATGVACLGPGDLLALYSDGITEARRTADDEEYGEPRMLAVIRAARHLGPVAIVDRVFADVAELARSSPPEDDQTLLVVKRRPIENEEDPA